MAADLLDVALVKLLHAGIVLDAVQEFVDAEGGVGGGVVPLVDQTADLDRLLRLLIGDVTVHDRTFRLGDADGDGEVVGSLQLPFEGVAAGENLLRGGLVGLVVLDDEGGAVGEFGVEHRLEKAAEEFQRIVEDVVVVLLDGLAVLLAADVQVLNLEIVDVDDDRGVELFAQVPAVDLAALDHLLQALDVVEHDVLHKAVAVAGLDLHVGDVFLGDQLEGGGGVGEDHRLVVAQLLTAVVDDDDEAVILVLQGDPQVGIGKKALLEAVSQRRVFGRVDFVEGQIVKGDVLVEQGGNGVDHVGDASIVDDCIDKGGADVLRKAQSGGLHVDQLFDDGADDVRKDAAGRGADNGKTGLIGRADRLLVQRLHVGAEFNEQSAGLAVGKLRDQLLPLILRQLLQQKAGGKDNLSAAQPVLNVGGVHHCDGGNLPAKALFAAEHAVFPKFFHV